MIDIPKIVKALRAGPEYQKWMERFKVDMDKAERLVATQTKHFLVFDIDEKKYMIKSELKVNYNQIVLQECTLPPKKDTKTTTTTIQINNYEYT
jgi:hypothetical protein